MIRCAALVLLLLWSVAAHAVTVRTEEHDGFSRLIFTLSSEVRWSVNQGGKEGSVDFDNADVDRPYLYGNIADLRVRAFDIETKGPGHFTAHFSLGCDCGLKMSASAKSLAVDIIDPGAAVASFPVSNIAALPRPRPGIPLATGGQGRTAATAPPSTAPPARGTGPVPRPRTPAMSEAELRLALAHQISEAVEAGLLTPAVSGDNASGNGAAPAEPSPHPVVPAALRRDEAATTPVDDPSASATRAPGPEPAGGDHPPSAGARKQARETAAAISSTSSAASASSERPDKPNKEAAPAVQEPMPAGSPECPSLPALPPFDPRGFNEAARLLRSELVGEFDQADRQRLESLGDLYLVHGMFVEAARLLALQTEGPRQRAATRLARAAEGHPVAPYLSGCEGPAAVVEATEQALLGQDEAALSAFARSDQAASFTGYLRTALLVPVLDAAIRLKRGDLGLAIFEQAWTAGERKSPFAAIRRAQVAALTADTVQERDALQIVAGAPVRERDDALLRLAELDLAEGRMPVLNGLEEILSEAPRHSRALILMAEANGAADAWNDALSYADTAPLLDALNAIFSGPADARRQLLSAAIEPGLPARLQGRPQIAEFLGHALLAAGLPEQAARYGVHRAGGSSVSTPPSTPKDALEGADKVIEQVTQFLEKPPNG